MAPPTILICDDEPTLRELMRVSLGDGYAFAEAADVPEAIDLANAVHPDLVLLDVMMPQVDGWEMLRRVHERHGVGAIPVVMFSGKVDERAADEAATRGAQGFIGKPFNPHDLIDQTKQLLPT
jgi:CheY-like chemotaxis protein